MAGIVATRSTTGEQVEIVVDENGLLSARTPDGTVLQSQGVGASRLRMSGDALAWNRVEYRVGDIEATRRLVESLATSRGRFRTLALPVGLLVFGLACGAIGALIVRDRVTSVDCAEARSLATASFDRIQNLNDENPEQNPGFFASAIVEQRKITSVMENQPACFTIGERADADGLLEGLRGLLASNSG